MQYFRIAILAVSIASGSPITASACGKCEYKDRVTGACFPKAGCIVEKLNPLQPSNPAPALQPNPTPDAIGLPDEEAKKLADRLSKIVTGKTIDENAEHLAKELGNAPESYAACLKDLQKCSQKTLARGVYLLCWKIIREYKASLDDQADARWQIIPDNVATAIAVHYPEINIREVRFVTNINTIHGQTVTWGNNIYTPLSSIDFGKVTDASLIFHELEHVVQYQKKGEEPFLGEYILKSAGKIIEKRSLNVHDDVDIEKAAIAKEQLLTPKYCGETTCAF